MLKNKKKTTTIHININDETLELFDSAFPSCRRRFIQNAMDLALKNKELFDRIFFCDIIQNHGFNHSSI